MAERATSLMRYLRQIAAAREFALVVVLLIMGTAMTIASPVFLDMGNLEAILVALSVEGTIAVGMMRPAAPAGQTIRVASSVNMANVFTSPVPDSGYIAERLKKLLSASASRSGRR